MANTLHTNIINSFLVRRLSEAYVHITVEEVDNTTISKRTIDKLSGIMNVNTFTAALESIIDNLKETNPSASIKVVDEDTSQILNNSDRNVLVSTEIIVKFKFLNV